MATTTTRRGSPRARGSGRGSAAPSLEVHFARTAILAAAQRAFSDHGIAATRVEDILVAANIARRTFYRYFASKDAVLAELYQIWTTQVLAAVEAARARQPSTPLAGIRAGVDIFLGFYRTAPRALRELVELAMRSDSALADRRRWLRAQLVRVIDEAVVALDGRRLDPFLYYGLLSALEGISLELGSDTTNAEVDRAMRVTHALIDHVLGLPSPASLPRRREPSA